MGGAGFDEIVARSNYRNRPPPENQDGQKKRKWGCAEMSADTYHTH